MAGSSKLAAATAAILGAAADVLTKTHISNSFAADGKLIVVCRDRFDAAARGGAIVEALQIRGRTFGFVNARTGAETWLFAESNGLNNVPLAHALLDGDPRGAIIKGIVLSSAGAERSKPSRS